MQPLAPRRFHHPCRVEPAEPLWKRVPTRGEDGRALGDFMMLIPRLRDRSTSELLSVIERIQTVLDHYRHAVVFADLNPRLNVLWVTVRPIPGISLDLACAISTLVPEARLVAQKRVP